MIALAEQLQDEEGGDDARVGPEVVAVVVVARVLPAEDGPRLGHHLLDDGMAHLGADRLSAQLGHDLGHHVRADEVVEDRLGVLVDQENAIGIAVEGEPDVGALLEHGRLQVDEVLGLDRIGRVIREVPVELGEEDLDREGKPLEHDRHHEATHAVGGVGHDLQRTQRRDVDEGDYVVPVWGGSGAPSSSSAPASMSASPVSRPIGRAPDRHSLSPLYCAGLCDAVNMAPGESR